MQNESDLIDQYIAEGGTQEKLAKKIQKINHCAYCKDVPIVFVDSYFDEKKDLQVFGLCQKCLSLYHEDNVGFKNKIIRKLTQLAKKLQEDLKWDIPNYN